MLLKRKHLLYIAYRIYKSNDFHSYSVIFKFYLNMTSSYKVGGYAIIIKVLKYVKLIVFLKRF